MKKIIYILASVLLFTFILTGCKKNIVITTGFNEGELVKISGKAVSSSEAMILLFGEKEAYDNGLDEEFWKIEYKDKTMSEYFKENIKERFIKLNVLSQYAKSKNVTLSEEEKKLIDDVTKEYMDGANADVLKKYNITSKNVKSLVEKIVLSEKVSKKVLDGYEIEISDEEARVMYVNYIVIDGKYTNASVIAEEIYNKAVSGNAMSTLAEKYECAKFVEASISRNTFSEENSIGIFKLKDGEISQIINDNDNIYILKCINDYDATMTETNKGVLVEQKKQEEFNKEYRPYEKDVNVEFNTDLWDKIVIPSRDEKIGINIYSLIEERTAK